MWLTSLFVAGFVYSGWVLSNNLGTNFHFERHALACAMMLLCQSSGVALLCALRWKKANGVLLDLGDWTNLWRNLDKSMNKKRIKYCVCIYIYIYNPADFCSLHHLQRICWRQFELRLEVLVLEETPVHLGWLYLPLRMIYSTPQRPWFVVDCS